MATIDRFLQLAEKYSNLPEFDIAAVNKLIKKISGKKYVTINVYFTYVEKIRIPLFKSEPLIA